jgi:hypothetical protein
MCQSAGSYSAYAYANMTCTYLDVTQLEPASGKAIEVYVAVYKLPLTNQTGTVMLFGY